MLVSNKSFHHNDVICIKFVTGEEIIARFRSEDHEYLHVTNPLTMILTSVVDPETKEDHALVAFAPYLLGAIDNDIIPLSRQHIIAKVRAREDAASQFLQTLEPAAEPMTPSNTQVRATSASAGGRGARGVKF